jgi:hypothetical protein
MKIVTQDPMPKLTNHNVVCFEHSPQASSNLPPLKLPARDITDPGILRLGGSNITSAR